MFYSPQKGVICYMVFDIEMWFQSKLPYSVIKRKNLLQNICWRIYYKQFVSTNVNKLLRNVKLTDL